MEDEEIHVEIDKDEAPETVETVITPEDGISELKRQLESERALRLQAEQRAHQAKSEAYQAKNEVQDTNLQLVMNAIDTVAREIELMKRDHTVALQNGDFAAATEIQSKMASSAADLHQLENGRDAMRNQPRIPEPVQAPSDPVEALASQLTIRSAEWVRKHPEFVRDPALNRKMVAAHNFAVAEGIPTDTDEYFSTIESMLKIKPKDVVEQNQTDDDYAAKVTQRRDAAPAAAPPSRGAPTTSRTNVVRLTSAQREMAEMMNMKPEEYAKNLVALKKEGKIQ